MANGVKVGDTVYVPCSAFSELDDHDTALYRTKVVTAANKSVTVDLPKGKVSSSIGAGRVHKDVGILLIEIGDFETEAATLDPLSKSVLQFCRLLVPDDQLRSVKVRSLAELKIFWKQNQKAYTHVILVGHADENVLSFAVDGDVAVAHLGAELKIKNTAGKVFVSLACKTGFQSFGGEFSKLSLCKYFLAPFHSVHSAVASQFCQTFLAAHFLDGKTPKVAFNHAKVCVPGGVSFRMWHNGGMV